MEIHAITREHPLWEKTIVFAESCSWRAGPHLAKQMKDDRFATWERVIVACEGDEIIGYCTLCEKDELPDSHAFTPFIGFVFVDECHRGKRISGQMIRHACRYAVSLGYKAVYLLSGEVGLYEKYGFQKLGEYETIYGSVDQLFRLALPFADEH